MTASKLVWPLLAVLLASCIMPTNYVAVLTVDKDVCRMEYKGQFQVDEALKSDNSESEARDATLADMTRLENEVRLAGGSMVGHFVRRGIFEAAIVLTETIGETPKTVLSLVTVERDSEGRVTVKSFDASEEDKQDFSRQGLEGKGELRVKTRGKIVQSNAQANPGFFSRYSGWKLDIMKTEPAGMVIQF